jgi:hypothetical protein
MEINGLISTGHLIILLMAAVAEEKRARGENNLLNYDIYNIRAGGNFVGRHADGDS